MAFITFAYLKAVKKNQQTFTPGSPVTSTVKLNDYAVEGIPAISGAAAPSTLIVDKYSNNSQYYCNKPFSAFLAAATAATSDATTIVIV